METLADVVGTKGSNVRVVSPEATVFEAAAEMCQHRIGALIVVQGTTLVGIFSERDLMRRVVLERRDPATTRVGDVMSGNVVTVTRHMHPQEAMRLMTDCRVRHLPVTDGGRLAGLVSIGDLVRWSVAERDRQIDELQGYVEGRYPG